MKVYYYLIFLILNSLNSFIIGEFNLDCLKAENCSSCIQIVNCGWCLDEKFESRTGKRCDLYNELKKNDCPLDKIYYPINSVEVIEDTILNNQNELNNSPRLSFKDFLNNEINEKNNKLLSRLNRNQIKKSKTIRSKRQNSINQDDKIVQFQLKPDKIKLKIRPNTKIRFNLTFEQAEKYPLDVYYLMDLTYSMKDHLDALVKLADKISQSMSDVTTLFRLGFGSFVDKVVMPYSNMLPEKLNNPCNNNVPCIPAYGYRNHLSLTNDSKLFLEKVKEARLSGNLDNAEGGFDALVQAIVCKKEINWSFPSRKIILFATDSLFHYAGDGKLGGIVRPNDGKCHLSKEGYYTETINQDYPSIEQINKILVSNQINIIFAVPKSASKIYEILSENLQGSITGELADDSSNIVDLIRENYKKIVSTIELSGCTSESGSLKETNLCENVGVGQKLQFEVELEIKSCKEFKNKNQNFFIFPLGIEEKTEIELELICDCECDSKIEYKSEYCNANGNLKCGVCDCENTEYFGNRCECLVNNNQSSYSYFNDECTINNQICSNKGTCMCNRCMCEDKTKDNLLIFGKFCECDSYSCQNSDGLTCSNRGRCCNKKCECIEGYIGEACECSLDTSTCLSPINNKICSGNGKCECGKCQCDRKSTGEIYTGRYCSDCPTCSDDICSAYDYCVLCQAFNSGPYKSNCKENCNYFTSKIVKEFSYLKNQNVSTDLNQFQNPFDLLIKRCIMIDEDNCKYEFSYTYQISTERIYIEILEDKICPNVENILYFMFFIILFIILIGLLALLIWKVVISYKDKQDYKKFIDDLKKRKIVASGQNPLYTPPSTKFFNPLYKSKD